MRGVVEEWGNDAAHRSPLIAWIDLRLTQRKEGERSNDRSIKDHGRLMTEGKGAQEISCLFDKVRSLHWEMKTAARYTIPIL